MLGIEAAGLHVASDSSDGAFAPHSPDSILEAFASAARSAPEQPERGHGHVTATTPGHKHLQGTPATWEQQGLAVETSPNSVTDSLSVPLVP